MRLRHARLAIAAMLLILSSCGGGPGPAAEAGGPGFDRSKHFITVLTGPSSGIYYPIGGAFSTLFGGLGYPTSATATGATAENITAMLTGQGEMAIAMADSVIQAVEAFGAYEGKEPATELRAMMGLWPNYCQIVTTPDTGIRTFEDLRGRRVGVGAPNSGVELNARMMFEAHGMSYADCKVDYLSYGEAIDQMKNGQCDAAFVTSGLGNATIKELGAGKGVALVSLEDGPINYLVEKYPFYLEAEIPAEIYNTQDSAATVAVMNIMLVHKDLPDEVVYDLLENIYSPEGLRTIHEAHVTAADSISLETALRGVEGSPVPLHSGARRFYRDRGMLE